MDTGSSGSNTGWPHAPHESDFPHDREMARLGRWLLEGWAGASLVPGGVGLAACTEVGGRRYCTDRSSEAPHIRQ